MNRPIALLDAVFVVVFAVSLSSGGLWGYGMLSGGTLSLKLYVGAAIVSTLVFAVFLLMFAAMRDLYRSAPR